MTRTQFSLFLPVAWLPRAAVIGVMAWLAAGCTSVQTYVPSSYGQSGSLFGNYLAARHAGLNRDADRAAHFYSAALTHDPSDQNILERAFLLELNSGDLEKGVELAKRIVRLRPNDRLARLVLAADAVRAERYQEARNEIRKAGRGPLTDIVNALVMSWSYAGSGMTDVAVENLDELNRVGGLDLYKAFHAALIYDLAGESHKAEARFDEAMRLSNNGSIRVIEAYGRFLERDGRRAQARAVYETFADTVGNHPVIASAIYRTGKPKDGDVERMVPDAGAGAAEAIYALAGALAREREKSPDLPIVYLQMALFLRADFPIAQSLLADLLERSDRIEAAAKVYEGVSRSSPLWANSRIRIAHGLNSLKRPEDAISVLEDVIDVAPENLDVLISIADLHHDNEDYKQSAVYYARAVSQISVPEDRHWPIYYQYGIALERSDQWDLAEVYLKQALALRPNQPYVLNYLGYSWIDQGRNLTKAMGLIEKAVSLEPENGYIVDSLGWGHYQLGNYEDAVKYLERAVLLVPGDPIINDHLGDALWQVGRKLEARFQWSHALALDPDDKVRERAARKLKIGLDAVLVLEAGQGEVRAHSVEISRVDEAE